MPWQYYSHPFPKCLRSSFASCNNGTRAGVLKACYGNTWPWVPTDSQEPTQAAILDEKLESWRHAMAISWPCASHELSTSFSSCGHRPTAEVSDACYGHIMALSFAKVDQPGISEARSGNITALSFARVDQPGISEVLSGSIAALSLPKVYKLGTSEAHPQSLAI